MNSMRIGSLFSGIGGLELGLERAGLGETVWQVEIDAKARKVLEKHWPHCERYEDVKTVGAENLKRVDLICGGFPCQDLSVAGKGAGLAGERSGLWYEYRRIVGELRPTWVVIENVYRGWRRWVPAVRGDLGQLGYASVSICVRASDLGAMHERARCFIVAYADGQRKLQPQRCLEEVRRWARNCCSEASDSHEERRTSGRWLGSTWPATFREGGWSAEPDVVRMVHGISYELDVLRIGGLINETCDGPKTVSEVNYTVWRFLCAMWEYKESAASSPGLYIKRLHSAVPDLPYCDPCGRWLLGPRIEKDKGLRDLWSSFYSQPFNQAQELQSDLLKRAWSQKRPKAMGPDRADRVSMLGNAVCPPVAEVVGRFILTCQEACSA